MPSQNHYIIPKNLTNTIETNRARKSMESWNAKENDKTQKGKEDPEIWKANKDLAQPYSPHACRPLHFNMKLHTVHLYIYIYIFYIDIYQILILPWNDGSCEGMPHGTYINQRLKLLSVFLFHIDYNIPLAFWRAFRTDRTPSSESQSADGTTYEAKPAGQVEFSRFLKWKKDWKKHHWCRDAFLWFSIMYRTARSGRLRTRISQRYAWIFWRMITNYENHAVLVSCHSDRHKNVSCTQGEEISKDIYGSMTCKTWPLTGLPIAPLVFWELVHQLFGLPQSSDG